MVEDMGTYYRRRQSEELAAAERATTAEAATIHRSLAARYSALAGEPQLADLEPTGQTAEVVPLKTSSR